MGMQINQAPPPEAHQEQPAIVQEAPDSVANQDKPMEEQLGDKHPGYSFSMPNETQEQQPNPANENAESMNSTFQDGDPIDDKLQKDAYVDGGNVPGQEYHQEPSEQANEQPDGQSNTPQPSAEQNAQPTDNYQNDNNEQDYNNGYGY